MITALSLITSCGCNLNCSYCNIDQAKNANSHQIQLNTIKALQDGSFIENAKKVLNKINEDCGHITTIAFWGQEPTLTLRYITADIKHFLSTFPNVTQIDFSTNSVANGLDIVEFAKAIDENITHSFTLSIQMSYDGEEGTSNLRFADTNKIYTNLTAMFEALNQTKFKHLSFKGHFHGVVSLELLKKLNTISEIETYYKNLSDWSCYFENLVTNRKVEIYPGVSLNVENPVDATVDDGIRLSNFVKMSYKVDVKSNNIDGRHFQETLNSLLGAYFHPIEVVNDICYRGQDQEIGLRDILNHILKDPMYLKALNKHLSRQLYCGNGYLELKIMYDGTLINCQNHIFDTDISFLPTDDFSLRGCVKKSLATHRYFINPLKDSDEDIKYYFELFKNAKETSYMFIFKNTLILMYFLALSHQIDESYLTDMNKLITHAFYAAIENCCSHNNQVKSGSMFIRPTGYLKFMCNGFLDYVEQFPNKKWE